MAALGLCCCMQAFPSCIEWVYPSFWCVGFLLWWFLLLWSMGSRCVGFSSCGTGASVVVACGLH